MKFVLSSSQITQTVNGSQGSISISVQTFPTVNKPAWHVDDTVGQSYLFIYLSIIMGINLTNRSVKQRTVMLRCPQNGASAINLSVTSVSDRVRFPVLSQMKPRGRSPGGALLSIPRSFNLYSLASEGAGGYRITAVASWSGYDGAQPFFFLQKSPVFERLRAVRKNTIDVFPVGVKKKPKRTSLLLAPELTSPLLSASTIECGKPLRSPAVMPTSVKRGEIHLAAIGPNLICKKSFGKGRRIMDVC